MNYNQMLNSKCPLSLFFIFCFFYILKLDEHVRLLFLLRRRHATRELKNSKRILQRENDAFSLLNFAWVCVPGMAVMIIMMIQSTVIRENKCFCASIMTRIHTQIKGQSAANTDKKEWCSFFLFFVFVYSLQLRGTEDSVDCLGTLEKLQKNWKTPEIQEDKKRTAKKPQSESRKRTCLRKNSRTTTLIYKQAKSDQSHFADS